MGKVLPFPLARRKSLIERQAERAAELNQHAGDRHIRHQVDLQMQAMRRRGIAEDLIAAEARCFEAALRAAMWESVMSNFGAPQ